VLVFLERVWGTGYFGALVPLSAPVVASTLGPVPRSSTRILLNCQRGTGPPQVEEGAPGAFDVASGLLFRDSGGSCVAVFGADSVNMTRQNGL
jgi:hypothetical protein